jgi:hypothetical protein
VNDIEMRIRPAVPEDAPAACEAMRRSITLLCVADHRNNPAILERWLGNKTPEIFRSWIRPGCTLRSTETARRFYLARGFAQDGPAEGKFGMGSGYPMSKRLIAEGSGRAGK